MLSLFLFSSRLKWPQWTLNLSLRYSQTLQGSSFLIKLWRLLASAKFGSLAYRWVAHFCRFLFRRIWRHPCKVHRRQGLHHLAQAEQKSHQSRYEKRSKLADHLRLQIQVIFKFRAKILKKKLEQNFTQKMSPLSSFKKSLKNYFSFKLRDFNSYRLLTLKVLILAFRQKIGFFFQIPLKWKLLFYQMITIAHPRPLYYWPVTKFRPSSAPTWKNCTNLATYRMKIYCQNGKSLTF